MVKMVKMAQNDKNADFFSKFYVFVYENFKIHYFLENWVIFAIFASFLFLFPSNLIEKNPIRAILCLTSIFNGQRPPFRPKQTYPENLMVSAFVISEPIKTKNLILVVFNI